MVGVRARGICSFSTREASATPRMIEHPCPLYMLTRSLLAQAVSKDLDILLPCWVFYSLDIGIYILPRSQVLPMKPTPPQIGTVPQREEYQDSGNKRHPHRRASYLPTNE